MSETKANWSKRFNELPLQTRTIGSAMESLTRIQHLNMEKDRLKARNNQSILEINEHLKACYDRLNALEKEWMATAEFKKGIE